MSLHCLTAPQYKIDPSAIDDAVDAAVKAAVEQFGLKRFAESLTFISEIAEESMPLAA
jgi:hypothetical protein